MIELPQHLPFKEHLAVFLQLQSGMMQPDSTLFDNSFFVVIGYYGCHIGHAAVAQFYIVLVSYLVQTIIGRKML